MKIFAICQLECFKKMISSAVIIFVATVFSYGQNSVESNEISDVYIFSNLVDVVNPTPFYIALEDELDRNSNSFTIILNGDIIDHQIGEPSDDPQMKNVFRLLDLVGKYSNGKLIIIPGDRDWNNNQEGGFDCVDKLENTVKAYAKDHSINNFSWPVKNGCPGPFDLELDKHIQLIALNSQWWNHRFDKPRPSDASCKYATDQDIKEELGDIIEENGNRNVLIVGHHPIKSLGHSGGRFSITDHLKPFPILGTFKRSFQANVGGDYDLANDRLKTFMNLLMNEMYPRRNLIYASGHEKNQQILKIAKNYVINSGSIEKPDYAASDFTTMFSKKEVGVLKISYYTLGRVRSTFLKFDKNSQSLISDFEDELFRSACDLNAKDHSTEENLHVLPCRLYDRSISQDDVDRMSKEVVISAGEHYTRGWFTRLWMGNHYREDWALPIKASYLNIDTTFDGLQAIKTGGGRQTKSLRFQAEDGDYYTFRSVDKDPSKALDFELRQTIISKIFKDQTSAQQPYGALVVSPLLDHLSLLHAHPRLYVMPNVKALGPFQKVYGEMLGLLEEHPGKKNAKGAYFASANKILKSNQLFRKMYEDKSHIINKEEFIRARLFDILVGDWSKHEDNWKWAANKEGDNTIYRPIPRDRDMVFSQYDGILPSLADCPFGMPNTESFDHKIKGFKSLVYQARYMDRFLSTEANKSVYLEQARFIQEHISDADIELAVHSLPQSVFDNSGADIISKLKQRKKDLLEYAEKYYKWLNSEVEILGSTDEDYFEIESLEQGKVRIAIFDEKQRLRGMHQYYERIFDPKETKVLRIYGLGDKDIFEFINDYSSNLKLTLFGGKGKDSYINLKNSDAVDIYDLDLLDNEDSKGQIESIDHWDKSLYEYDRNKLKFNSWIPSFSIGYNAYNGFTTSVGNTWTIQKWNKQDYASKHAVQLNLSTRGDVGLTYGGRWHHALKRWDFLIDMTFANPEYFNSFYGIGNSTIIDDNLEASDYYIAHYNQYKLSFGLGRSFWKKSEFTVKAGMGIFNSKPTSGSIFLDPELNIFGGDGTIYAVPVAAKLDIDLRDHSNLPYRGVRTVFSLTNYFKLNGERDSYGSALGSLEYYLSNHNKKRMTLGLKLAGSKGFGDIPYYHQGSLGGNTGLRGFDSNRFTGRSIIYFNSEARLEVFSKEEVAIPWKLGVIAFYDTGRVFSENDPEGDKRGFRSGYGGGIFIIPYSRSFSMTFTLGWSEEESLYPGFTFGTSLK
jgi:hypothetical protein